MVEYRDYTPQNSVSIKWSGEYTHHSIECARLVEILNAALPVLEAQLAVSEYDPNDECDQQEAQDRQETINCCKMLLEYFTPVVVPDDDLPF